MQERSDVAKKVINVVKKKKAKMIRGVESLCDALITLAYMDVKRHKNEKSERPQTLKTRHTRAQGFHSVHPDVSA